MRIVVADDHPLYLEAVAIEIQKIFPSAEIITATHLDGAVHQITQSGPVDLVVADFSMPGMAAVTGVERLVAAANAPVVIVSGVANPHDVQACLAAGARGYLPKTMERAHFSAALTIVASGGSYVPVEFSQSFATSSPTAAAPASRLGDLTDRELEILRLVVDGHPNKEIARQLGFQEVTIKVNLTRIFAKLGAKNRAQAAAIAVESLRR